MSPHLIGLYRPMFIFAPMDVVLGGLGAWQCSVFTFKPLLKGQQLLDLTYSSLFSLTGDRPAYQATAPEGHITPATLRCPESS